MNRLLIIVAIIWLALIPPLFTGGACTAEFDAVEPLLHADQRLLRTPQPATTYLQARGIQPVVMTP